MIYVRIFATIFMLFHALVLYGLTELGFEPPKSQILFVILGFIAVFLAIWL